MRRPLLTPASRRVIEKVKQGKSRVASPVVRAVPVINASTLARLVQGLLAQGSSARPVA